MIYRLIKGKLKKGWWFYILLLAPFLSVTLYHYAVLPYMDLPYVLRDDFKSGKGIVDKVYLQGDNHLIIDGREYRYNPWEFDPIEESMYSFNYLPHSKYIIEATIVEE